MLPAFDPPAGIRVVYSDLDGTMLGRGGSFVHDPSGAFTLEPARVLAEAAAAGIEIVPCSGRAMPGIAGDGRILGLATAIGEMGAVVSYEGGRRIVEHLGEYPGGAAHPVALMESGGAIDFLMRTFPLEPHAPWARHREYTGLLRGLADTAEANDALRDAGHGWCVLVDNGVLHASYLGLPERTSHVYHLMPRGVSKGATVRADRELRGIDAAECVAMGDSLADLTMAGEVAAMAVTADAVADDAALAAAAAVIPNVGVTTRAGNLGWTDAIALLIARR